MARLSKSIKEQIVANALKKAGVLNREAALTSDRAKLAEACRVAYFGGQAAIDHLNKEVKSTKKKIDQLKTLSKNANGNMNCYFYGANSIRINFSGLQIALHYNGTLDGYGEDTVNKSPAPQYHVVALNLVNDDPLTLEFNRTEAEAKVIKDIRDNIEINTWAILNSVTTDKKLIEVWPESFELIPKAAANPIANLPTTDVKSLNDMIGIPTEKK